MDRRRLPELLAYLRARGAAPAAALAGALGISQPTVSRLLAAAGPLVVKIGRARATRYALTHEVARAGRRWPLYRIDREGRAGALGELHALHGGGFLFAAADRRSVLRSGGEGSGLFPGLPWFLDDQRPQGFLGRAFARRVAADIGAPADLARWTADDVVLALLRHGDDGPGDLVLGEQALQGALRRVVIDAGIIEASARGEAYPLLAEQALRGEDVGSSAGGEQPKFTAVLGHDGGAQAVIVKFSERRGTPAADRWADLLHCERLAGVVLRDHGLEAAAGEIVEAGGRVFLQSTRFDRTAVLGRRGFASLAALDGAFHGHGRIDWWRYARQLRGEGWLDTGDARRLALYGWFGALIANNDMHLGNAGLVLADARPLALVPAYDMLPMAFRPAATGEVVARDHAPPLPAPEFRDEWRQAADMAVDFWGRVATAADVSATFRAIAEEAATRVRGAAAKL